MRLHVSSSSFIAGVRLLSIGFVIYFNYKLQNLHLRSDMLKYWRYFRTKIY
ncbi:hypothetical protein A8990_1086 [Paenibacillus taihuensis]|uniref:Uncharacterized protein n=1 Tax=Paenibacillus taihuensis TaxID=1156355 RepID=A0A3D9SG05_9BACL|nr:hypothetical protein A8990_1086 [Paenibacillus taihuensis]